MTSCEKLEKCPFFSGHMPNLPAVAGLLKDEYCLGDKSNCARYLVASAGKPVPMDMFPNDTERAQQLLHS